MASGTLSGRGPTSVMLPSSTLSSCGSSSTLVRRSRAPTGVTRASPGAVTSGPAIEARIVRNFSNVKGTPPCPIRRWRKIAEPPVLNRTTAATHSSSGDKKISTVSATPMSSSRRAGLGAMPAPVLTRGKPGGPALSLDGMSRINCLLRRELVFCGDSRRGQPSGDQWVTAGIEAGAGGEVELEIVAEAADHAVGHGAPDREILAGVRAVPADLVAGARGVDHDL